MIMHYDLSRAHLFKTPNKPHGSTRMHDNLVKSQSKQLLKYGTCYCFNEEQKLDIIELANEEVTEKEIEGIIYLSLVN